MSTVPALPIPVLTPEQMSRVDRIMVDDFGVTVLQLMEVAGQAVAAWARDRFLEGNVRDKTVLVLAGSGGNGGDGMVAARFLHSWGAHPMVWLSHDAASLQGAAAHQFRSLRTLGLAIHSPTEPEREGPNVLPDADLIVDALLGFGLNGPPSGSSARLITAANAHLAPILAIDLPSGLDARTGDPYDPCIRADATLTLALPKAGLLAPAARPVIGELAMADIGIPAEVYDRIGVRVGPVFAQRSVVRVMGECSLWSR
jgi:NAD(P)H-hydrate epimerase